MAEIRNIEIAQRLKEVAALLDRARCQSLPRAGLPPCRRDGATAGRLAAEILQTEGVEGLPQRGFPGRSSYLSCGIWRHSFPRHQVL